MKEGDRVVWVGYPYNKVWTIWAIHGTRFEVVQFAGIFEENDTIYDSAMVESSRFVLESVYNSELYQLMRKVDKS